MATIRYFTAAQNGFIVLLLLPPISMRYVSALYANELLFYACLYEIVAKTISYCPK